MSPSQEILNSIEDRLAQLAEEIAALETARAELQAEKPVRRTRSGRAPERRSGRTDGRARAAGLSEEEWVERRAAELAAQSRRAAAA